MSGHAFHPEAYDDLDDIRGYIAQDNPDAADRVITEIFDAIRALVPFHHQGHRRPDLTSLPLRFIVVRDYLIAYAPDEKPLWVSTMRILISASFTFSSYLTCPSFVLQKKQNQRFVMKYAEGLAVIVGRRKLIKPRSLVDSVWER